MKYKIQFFQNDIYEVVELGRLVEGQSWDGWDDSYQDITVFQGRLADCEAYIRLHEGGYM